MKASIAMYVYLTMQPIHFLVARVQAPLQNLNLQALIWLYNSRVCIPKIVNTGDIFADRLVTNTLPECIR